MTKSRAEKFSGMYHSVDVENQFPIVLSPGELNQNREKYKGKVVIVQGILRRTTYQMGSDDLVSVHASEFVVSSGWRQFYVIIDPMDFSLMPISEPLGRDQWKEIEGKMVEMKVAIREVKGILGGIARVRNAFTAEEHRVTCIPQILELKEVGNSEQ